MRKPSPVYLRLLRECPLLPIRTAADRARAAVVLRRSAEIEALGRDGRGYIEVLSMIAERHDVAPGPNDATLRALMDVRGVTQAEVARATGIAPQTVCEVLAGRRRIPRRRIKILAEFLRIPPSCFA